MAVHPYSINTDAYNFFFHPLHEMEENVLKTAAAIIVNITLSIFSFGLWQLPFWIVNRLDNKKFEVWNISIETEKIEKVSSKILTRTKTVPLEKTGRIHHGTNTCFIAACIQLCRQMPDVRNALRAELEMKENESEEVFEYRKLVHNNLKAILLETEKGNDISPKKMNEFHSILHQYYQVYIPKPGKGGDTSLTFYTFLKALDIPYSYIFEEEPSPETDLHPHLLQRLYDSSKIKMKCSVQVEGDPFRQITYSLVGVACFGTGHSIAYMKDINNPSDQFILFDDLAPHKKASAIKPHPIWPATTYFIVYRRDD
ncbi:MAG: hypothetical protein H0T62_09765 [Parachlamydiaceae bacterium]|nr:hypothetical protein [Parachlamydiaceae bacterium]